MNLKEIKRYPFHPQLFSLNNNCKKQKGYLEESEVGVYIGRLERKMQAETAELPF